MAESVTGDPAAGEHETELKRTLGQKTLTFFILGDILGAGIYALVGEVGGAIWAAFGLALILAVLTAFAYAELVTKYPQAAGSALYVDRAFGIPFMTFMIGFAVMASGIASASTLSRAFAGDYLKELVEVPVLPVALLFIVVVAAVNLRGIAESVRLNIALTCIEVTGLALIVLIGFLAIGDSGVDFSRNFEFKEGESVVFAIVGGASLAFYALIGFEDSVNVAEETREPSRVFPKALFVGLGIAGLIYLLVTLTASMVVPTDVLSSSDGPLLEVVERGPLGIPLDLFAVIALFALANGALINMIMASRLVYGMSRRNVVPAVFSQVLAGRRTPWVSILFTTVIAMILISTGDIGTLADTTVLLLLLVFTIVNLTVLYLRRDPVEHEHFTAPSVLCVAGAIVSVLLMAKSIGDDPEIALRALLLLGVGVVLYVLNLVAVKGERAAS